VISDLAVRIYRIPQRYFEELIADGLWVGHKFELYGRRMMVVSIGQAELDDGRKVIPIGVTDDAETTS
jgi:hypothetical protein